MIPYRYKWRIAAAYRAFRAWIGYPLPEPVHEPLGDLIAATMRNYGEAIAENVTQRNALLLHLGKRRTIPAVDPNAVIRWHSAINDFARDSSVADDEAAIRKALRDERRRDLGLGPIE